MSTANDTNAPLTSSHAYDLWRYIHSRKLLHRISYIYVTKLGARPWNLELGTCIENNVCWVDQKQGSKFSEKFNLIHQRQIFLIVSELI